MNTFVAMDSNGEEKGLWGEELLGEELFGENLLKEHTSPKKNTSERSDEGERALKRRVCV